MHSKQQITVLGFSYPVCNTAFRWFSAVVEFFTEDLSQDLHFIEFMIAVLRRVELGAISCQFAVPLKWRAPDALKCRALVKKYIY